jgi:phosphatidate cytidylyltransferase
VNGATAGSARPEPLPSRRLRAPGFLSNLARRVATALVAVTLLLAVCFLAPPWATVLLVAAALAGGLHELFALIASRGIRPFRVAGALVALLAFVDVVWPGRFSPPLTPLAVVVLLAMALRRGGDHESVVAAAATLLASLYIGGLGGMIGALRLLPPAAEAPWHFISLAFIVMISDSVAFFVGNAAGRHRLAPLVSPGKSVEGALGGLAGGVLGIFLVRQLGMPQLPASHAVALGLLVAAMGIVGDLDESLIKRWAGVKDSGRFFPGHGGMLDRLDSLLFGAPVLYYYFQHVR